MTVWIGFLRAVNVGGVNRLPMAEFRDMLAGLAHGGQGLVGVKTYIQSGNAVFQSDLPQPVLGAMIADAVLARFGFRPPILLLTRAELEAALAANPFPKAAPDKLHYFFMDRSLPNATAAFLKSLAGPTEEYAFHGKILWLHLPDGIGRSKLAHRVMNLPLDITARNGKSVAAIAILARKLAAAA